MFLNIKKCVIKHKIKYKYNKKISYLCKIIKIFFMEIKLNVPESYGKAAIIVFTTCPDCGEAIILTDNEVVKGLLNNKEFGIGKVHIPYKHVCPNARKEGASLRYVDFISAEKIKNKKKYQMSIEELKNLNENE